MKNSWNFNAQYIRIVAHALRLPIKKKQKHMVTFPSKCLGRHQNRWWRFVYMYIGLILGLRPANERRRYKVTPSLIGSAQTLCTCNGITHWCDSFLSELFQVKVLTIFIIIIIIIIMHWNWYSDFGKALDFMKFYYPQPFRLEGYCRTG